MLIPADYKVAIAILERHAFEHPEQRRRIIAELNDQLAKVNHNTKPEVLFVPAGEAGGWLIGDPAKPTHWRTARETMAPWAAYAAFSQPRGVHPASLYSEATDHATSLRNALRALADALNDRSRG